jgi:hypothetical protein
MSPNDLQNTLLDRAEGKLPSDDDSPWAKFDYLKLRETLEAIISCMEATTQQTESPPDSSPMKSQPETTARLVISNDQPANAEAPFLKKPQEPAA